MPKINDFTAWITVDGNALGEYGIQGDEETKTISCLIPSEAGKAYIVRWYNHNFRSPTCGKVQIDGHYCGGYVLPAATCIQGYQAGIYTTSTTLTPFIFSQVQTSDDQALLSVPATPDIGLISLRIYNVRIIESGVPLSRVPPQSRMYHEKTTKGLNHQTSFQLSVPVPATMSYRTEPIGPPAAVFHFRYRPLAILQAQEVVPRPPGPLQHSSLSPPHSGPPESRKRIKIELDSDGEVIDSEDDEDEARLVELQEQMDTIRAKQHPRKKIKRETKTIDLTADS